MTDRSTLRKIARAASELYQLLEANPKLAGYADNEAGNAALLGFMEELHEVGYSAEMALED